jgi:hypothetical protein
MNTVLRQSLVLASVGLVCLGATRSRAAHADIEYQELEVYTHQMDGEGSKEFENLTSFSNNVKGSDTGVFRSSMEFEYGVTNNFQIAAYTDFDNQASNNGFNFTELRVRGRYSFFEQNQLPVDIGAYAELAFPRYEDNKMEGELRLIVSKDVDRFTFSVNPTVERPLIVQNDASTDLEWGVSASVAYRVDNKWLPHLDVFGALGEDETLDDGSSVSTNQLMLVPAVDYQVARGFAVGARVGFGLTDATERNLAALRLEYEL